MLLVAGGDLSHIRSGPGAFIRLFRLLFTTNMEVRITTPIVNKKKKGSESQIITDPCEARGTLSPLGHSPRC